MRRRWRRRCSGLPILPQRIQNLFIFSARNPAARIPNWAYIVPADQRRDRPSGVRCFVEKPSVKEAAALAAQGALVNISIVAGSVGALLSMYKQAYANEVLTLGAALRSCGGDLTRLASAYEQLPAVDFSHDVLTRQTSTLRVLPVPDCGWTDLGTPERVAEVLKTPPRRSSIQGPRSSALAYLSLAARWVAPD